MENGDVIFSRPQFLILLIIWATIDETKSFQYKMGFEA
jgi:hypothetical protein